MIHPLATLWQKHEARFAQRNYDGDHRHITRMQPGTQPVLLLAPHAVNHYQANGMLKPADLCTGGLVLACAEHFNVSAIANTGRHIHITPHKAENYVPPIEHHAYNMARQNKAILDIHGMKDDNPFVCAIGTSGSPTPQQSAIINICLQALTPVGPVAVNPGAYAARNPTTLTHRLKNNNIPHIIQLEIARNLRVSMGQTEPSHAFLQAFQTLLDALATI